MNDCLSEINKYTYIKDKNIQFKEYSDDLVNVKCIEITKII